MNDRLGVLIAVLSSTFGGMAGAVTRFVVGTVDPVTIAAFRFGIGVAVLLPLALLLRSALPRRRDLLGAGLLGVMFFAVFFVFYNIALAFTTGMLATVNPCGFAMLPAYLSYFLGVESADGKCATEDITSTFVGTLA